MVVRALVGVLALGGVVACSPFGGGAFRCERDDQCGPGTCTTGYCSFADGSCPSGQRFGDASGALSNTCVAGTSGEPGALDARATLDAPAAGIVCYGSGFAKTCFTSANAPATAATLTAQTIDTDASPLCSTVVEHDPGGCVIAATDLSITGTVNAIGSRPLVLVASDLLQVDGTLDVASHRGGQLGAGSVAANPSRCDPGAPPGTNGGGGAGGSFGTSGGAGGNGGGIAGAIEPTNALRGGCPGQDGKAGTHGARGAGGGAVYLIAGVRITVGGAINASGAAGTAGVTGNAGAGGGGSGGFIGLDAPTVMNGGAIFANGGGGAEGSGNTTKGNDGNESSLGTAAATTASASNGGEGGAGGALTAAGKGADANGFGGGGGGGGGAGVIQVFGAAAITGGTVSPRAR